jgi:hypothetical protein
MPNRMVKAMEGLTKVDGSYNGYFFRLAHSF